MRLCMLSLLLVCLYSLTTAAHAQIKAAFIYVGPAKEVGWSHSHDEGRQYLEKVFGADVKTEYAEFVQEGRASAEAIRKLAENNDIIFTTSQGYMVTTARVAREFPAVKFDNATGLRLSDNLGSYAARAYEPRYLSGMIAGAMTRSNRIGFVAAHAIPEVIRGINAFTLGVRRVNPQAVVEVKWTRQWYAPDKASELARELLESGADVLTHHTDSPAVVKEAEAAGVFAISFHSNMSEFAPTKQIASVGYDWGKYYATQIQALKEGNWSSKRLWLGMSEDIAQLNNLSDQIPAAVRDQVSQVEKEIKNKTFSVFSGPVLNSRGRPLVRAGESLTDDELLRMNWYVQGVVGEMPSF